MEIEVQNLLDSLADLREKANVNAVFGEPVTAEGRIIIPVAKVAYCFGMEVGHETVAGGETAEKSTEDVGGSGGGGAVLAHPLAVVEVTPEGTRVEPIVDEQKVTLAATLLTGWVVICLARALVKIFGQQE